MKRIITLLIIVLYALVGFSQENNKSESSVPIEHSKSEADSYQAFKAKIAKPSSRAAGFNQRVVKPDGTSGGINVKGDITFIGNNILSKYVGWPNYNANRPYDGYEANGQVNMQYIDIDGDPSTVSSSSDQLNLPNCSRVVYAGLYWAGIYPYENWYTSPYSRQHNPNNIKFQLPGQGYQDITADETIFDDNSTYINYKDITSLVQGLVTVATPNGHNGRYMAGNIRAIRGRQGGVGGAAGWTMVIIYENDLESSKNISVFDGYAEVDGRNDVDLTYSGFSTIPLGPVRVNLLAATLEGDRSIPGDRFRIRDRFGNFISQTTGSNNLTNNFFNGSMTRYNNFVTSRVPDGENTLGFDVDLYELNNGGNSVIENNQSSIDVQFTTGGDVYWPFLNALAVEIIEPKVQLIKTIEDASGNDIQGTPVGLGNELFYNISFQNVGTDHARNTIITDRLPKNVDLLTTTAPNGSVAPDGTRFDIDLPPGVSITAYDPPSAANDNRAELEISVPDNMVLEGGALYNIRMHVQVVTDCSQLRDVCSNEVRNQAFARYEGVRGGVVINNEPSFSGLDDCNFGIVGTSNFLVDTSGCSFETTQVMCGSSITLTAGAGFESYEWRDASGTLLGTTTVPSFDVTNEGTYTVNKIASAASGCINAEETIHVVGYNSEPNPLQPFADQVLTCASNGEELAEVYLCGDSGSRTINLPFDTSSATTVQWFKLDESSCTDVTESGCPNINTGCTWNEVGSGEFSRNFADAGEYRLDVLYDGRCPKSYYFNVYKATLNPTFITQDILCGNNGSITVNNIPAGYQYSLTGPGGYNAPFQNSNVFSNLTAAGNYNLSIRVSSASAASCTYTFPPINIQENDIDMDVITTPMQCFNDSAQIRVQVNNVPGDYTYELLQGGSVVGIEGPTANNDFTFNVTDGGAYTVRVTTPQCTATETIVINEPDELLLTALKTKDITCESGSSDGIIQLTASGGTLDTSSGNNYNFAVWTSQGTDLYTNPSDIPNTAFLTPATNPYTYNVPVGSEGIYRFIVIDDNNCYTISDPVEITVEPELAFTHSETDVTCNGLTDGTINVSVNGDNLGYAVEYSIDNATWNTTGAFDSLDDGTYTIYIRASKNSYQCLYEIPNVVINEPASLNGGSATKTDLECNTSGGTTFGTITYTAPTGGTPNYTYYYKLNSAATYTLAANNPVTGLPAGTYNTRAIDASGCIIDLNNVTINGLPSAPNVTSSVVYNCDGTGNVTITATPAGTYTYTLNGNSNTTGVFNNVPVGGYTAEVTYGGSCVEDIRVRVNAGNEFSGSIVGSTDSECYGSDNGSITILANNVIGGSFEYSTDGGATWSMTADNPYRVVGLAAGTYNVFIREADGGVASCVIDLGNVTIGQPEELTLAASVTQEVTCNIATGTITATATGGIPPYEYSIDGGASWHSSNVFNNVPPRATDYVVMVRDSRNCNECGCTAKLFQNGSFERPAETTTRFRFYNEDDIPGWDSTASDNQIELWHNGFNGVTAYEGNSFAELNANRVSSLYQEYCTQPGDIITWSVAHRGRSGLDRATVKIGGDLATAGVVETMETNNTAWKVYTGSYTVPVGQSTTIIAFDALSTAGGNNTVGNFIDDVQINIASTTCVPVSVPVIEPNTVDFDLTPTLCYDGSGNGEIRVEVTSGNNDYQFRIDGGIWQNPNVATPDEFTFTGLTDGTYSIEVRDGLGCTIPAKDATILPQLTATITTVSATCNDGQIVITPNGGDGNYEFIVETGGVQTSYTSSPIAVPAGTYTVYVRDKNGGTNYCEYSDTVTVNQIAAPTVSSTSTQPNCSTDTGTINVTVGSGTSPYTVTVTGPGGPFVQGPSADVNYSFTGLGDGTYQITVSDANGCPPVATSTETINVPTALAGGSASKTDLMCSPTGTILGTISFTAPTGGTAPYIYYYRLVGGGAYTQIAGTTVSNLPAGDYETKVEDSNGCERILDTLTIADLPAVPPFASTVVYNCDGTGNITITPFDASYTYSLDGAAAQTGANANIFNNVAAGAHTVTVDYGSNCTEDVLVTVAADQEFTAAVINTTNPTCLGYNNGSIEVEASFPSSTPTEFEYNIGAGWVSTSGNNPFVIPNFTSGTHTIEVRPVGGIAACEQTVSATLTDPSVVTVVAPVTKEVTCVPATGATITPNGSGGNGAPFSYELFDNGGTSLGTTTTEFTDVAAGTYTVVATDRLGCDSSPVTVMINPSQTVDFDLTPTLCYDGSGNGEIRVEVTSGNNDYQFRIDGGIWQNPNVATPDEFTFTGLTDGTYSIEVRDGLGCTTPAKDATILPQLTATITTVSATCNDGQIVITPNGGDGNYEFIVETGGVQTSYTSSPIAVPAGTYTVYVRDKNGGTNYCEYSDTVTVNQIAAPTVSSTSTQPNCSTDTGTINVTVGSGTSPYTVTVTGPGGPFVQGPSADVNYSFTGLGDGTYQITVSDANGCPPVATSTETINVPTALAGGSASKTDLMCSPTGTILGTISFTAPTGGTAPYIYYYRLVGGGAYTQIAGTTVSNLPAGDYETKVEDSNGCERILDTLTIADLPAVPPFASTVVYNCDGTGNITITPFDASYTYSLDGAAAQTGANANIFNNVAAGAHTVTVDYGSNCTEDVLVTVAADQEFTAAVINTTNPTCLGYNNGSIEVEASFPSSTPTEFEYNIGAGWVSTSGNNPFVIPNFTSGTHTIEVRPVGGIAACEQTVSATLTDPSVVTVVAPVTKEVTCVPATGATITPNGSGGNGAPFSYELFDNGGTSLGTTTTEFTDVAAGTYTVVATDRLGCDSSPVTVMINPSQTVDFDVATTCFDGTSGSILVTNTVGNGDYQYNINGNPWQNPDAATPNQYTFTGLTPNTYTVNVKDGRGCITTKNITINPQLQATATPTNASCTLGSIEINATGGTGAGTYEYAVVTAGSPAPTTGFSNTNLITNLAANTYDVYVRDSSTCSYVIEDVVIAYIMPVDITATPNNPTCNGDRGSVDGEIIVNRGQGPYTITIEDSSNTEIDRLDNFIGTNFSFNNLAVDTYEIKITDALGCEDTFDFTLEELPPLTADLSSILPVCGTPFLGNENLFGFEFTNYPTVPTPYSVEFSKDDGATWQSSPTFTGIDSGTIVYPAIRIVEADGVTTRCIFNFGRYEVPYPVEGLIVNPVANPTSCNEGFSVTVEAFLGAGPFQFAIGTPSGWVDPDIDSPAPPAPAPVPDQDRTYTFKNLTPGLTYVFYVKDLNGTPLDTTDDCIKQNNEDVYATFTPSVPITPTVNNNQCSGSSNGQITFEIDNTSTDLNNNFTWTLYERDPVTNAGTALPAYTNVPQTGFAPIVATGLPSGVYYIILSNTTGGPPVCEFGSLDVTIKEGQPITGNLNKLNDITCNVPGKIRVENVLGGFAPYTYNVTLSEATATATVTGNEITVTAPTSITSVDVTVEVEDSNGTGACTANLGTVTLNVAQLPTATAVADSCPANKTITATVTTGVAPYQYSLNGGATFSTETTNTTFTQNNVTPGSYDIVVRDATGCESVPTTVIVHENVTFDVVPTKNAECVLNGEATLTINSGSHNTATFTANYTYSVDGGAPVAIPAGNTTAIISLAPGTYTVSVTDINTGCTTGTQTVTIEDAEIPSFTALAEASLCSGDDSGRITLTAVDNGILPLTYSIVPAAGTITGNVITDLPPGTYSVTGEGTNGCTFTVTDIVIDEYAPIVPSTPVVEQFGCSTGNTVDVATVTIPAGTVGGSTNYTRYVFVYTPADGSGPITQDGPSTSFSTTNTSGGPVQITVYDDKGCSGVENTTIDAYVAITGVTISPQRTIDCNEGEDIEATYTINTGGALANFEFRLYDDTNALLETRTNTDGDFTTLLATGTYRVELENRDTNCIYTEYHTVEAEPTFDILITNVDDVDCKGDNNGSAVLSFVPSTPPYTSGYSYIVYDATTGTATAVTGTGTAGTPETITGLVAGEYYVRIDMGTNSPFCEAQSANFTIAEPADSLSVTGVTNPVVSCYNGSDATITATGSGGWGDYVYQLEETATPGVAYAGNTFSSNNIFTNLPAGDYTVVVRDKNGAVGLYCESTDQVIIANPAEVTFTVTENDNSCDSSIGGSISVTATGGTGTYTYTLSNGSGVVETQILNAANYTFTNLAADAYTVNVVDSNGCTEGTPTDVTITPDLVFTLTETKKLTCNAPMAATVALEVTSGSGSYAYEVAGPSIAVGRTNLAGTTLTLNPTVAGVYTVTVYDTGATPECSVVKTIEIQDAEIPSFTASAEASLCSGDNSGRITLTAVDNGILPLNYSIIPAAGTITGNVITDLPPGTYSVTGEGTNGCTFTVTDIVIDEYAPIVPSTPVVDQFGCSAGNTVDVATVTIPAGTVGGSTNYTRYVFVYTPADGSGPITQDGPSTSFSTTNTSGGPVQITVYDDKGCSGVENTTIDAYVAITGVTISPQRTIDCNEGEDIEATYTINTGGALANFEFRLYDDTNALLETRTNTDGDFTTLLATGTYRVELENRDTNCIYTEYHTVEAEPTFDILITNIDDVDCKGDNNGSAVLSFVPSTPPYTSGYSYIVYDATTGTATAVTGTGTAGTPETITGLVAGEYYVRIDMGTNSPFCEAQSANFTIAEPADSLSVTGVTNPVVSCYNGSDATITATGSGGWGDYVYQLEETATPGVAYAGNTFSSNNIFTNLPAGDYTVVVRDKNGAVGLYCESTDQVIIANPAEVTFTVTENDNSCDSSIGGSISVTATGGTGTYTYTLSNGSGVVETQILNAANYTFTNLAADAYTVNVVDSNGCTEGTPTDVTITPDLVFTLTETKKLTCNAPMAATVALEVTSGSGSYAYEVAGPSIAVGRTNLAGTTLTLNPTVAGVYTVTVYDTGATPECSVVKTIEIEDAETPNFTAVATVTDICFGTSTGEVTVSPVDNGILPLSYEINNVSGTFNDVLTGSDTVFTNLPADDYIVTATGVNGCTTDVTVSINQNDIIDISNAITVTQFACTAGTNTTNNAIITVDKAAIIGGTGNYVRVVFEDNATGDVLQDDSNFTYISTNLAGGDYTVKVYDENTDCFVSRVVTIAPFTPMTGADIKVEKNTDCNTGENITVKVVPALPNIQYTITGTGATPYTRTLNVVSDADAAVFNNVPVDDYTIEIYNAATGCTLEVYHTVEPEPTFDILVSNVQRACFGGTGSATIDFSAATPYTDVYTYEVFEVGNPTAITLGNGTGGTPETITTNLVAGEYYVVVSMTNTPFCEAQSENFIIEEPATALALTGTPTYIKCGFPGSGEILLEAQGGWAPYEYQLVNDLTPATPIQNFDSNRRITGLIAGNYTATVRDVTGCEETFTFTLQPTTPMAADVTVTPNLCEGERTATIQVTNVTGGQTQDATVSYSYILTYPDGVTQVEQLSNTFSNLPAGTNYTVTVRDNKYSCTYTEQVDIIDPSEVEASANITADITCNNRYATVVVSAIGGTGNYEYSSDGVNFVPNNTFINVSSGSQTFYVRDDNNCEDTVVVTVNAYEPLVPTLVVDSGFVTCNGDANGVLSATVAGGFGNYEYQLLDGSNNPIDGTWTTSNTFGGLDVGTYKIRVRSTNRFGEVCTEDTAPHPIVEPEPLVVAENHTDVSCFGGNDGTITVLASGGNLTGYEYNISTDPTNKFVTDNVFRNLTAGTYTITVKDKVGCIDTIDVVIDQPQQFTATLVGVTEQTCINNATPTIELDVQGGTQPYYVSINNIEQPTPYTTNTIVLGAAENIQAGTSYYITVRDEAGCNVADPIRVTTAEPVDLQLTVDFAYTCEVGNIIKAIVDEAYRANMSYTLYDGIGNPVVTNNTGEFIDVPAGIGYYVTATHTITSCSESSTSSSISIEDIQALTLDIDDSVKNTLIANADFGLPPYEYSVDGGDFGSDNEFLILQTKDYTITVRDARGCEETVTIRGEYITIFVPNLFTPDGDGTNDYWYPREVEEYHDIQVFIYDRYARNIAEFKGSVEGWDGTYEGTPLPSGDYWYTIYFKELSGQEKKIMGHFTLYR